MTISKYSLSSAKLYPYGAYTLSMTIKNTLGSSAIRISVWAYVDIPYTDEFGDTVTERITVDYGERDISWANNSTNTFNYVSTIEPGIWDLLNNIHGIDPSANTRNNPIYWQIELTPSDWETESDISTFQTGQFLDWAYAPTIQTFSIERALDGLPNDEGESLLTTMQLSLSEKARMELISLKLYYAEAAAATTASAYIDLTASIPDLLAGVTDSGSLITQTFGNTSNWSFLLVFGDEYESASAALSIPRAFANLHLSGASTGGAAFGGFSTSEEGNPKLESHYPAYFYESVNIEGDLIYKKQRFGFFPGDTVALGWTTEFPGKITGSTKSVYFTINLGEPIYADEISLSGAVVLRGTSGYLNGSSSAGTISVGASGYTWTVNNIIKKAGIVCVTIAKSSAYSNVTNNTPVAVTASALTLTFS